MSLNFNFNFSSALHITKFEFNLFKLIFFLQFYCTDSPGFNINFENAPFKLTREYLEVMGGIDSPAFKMFEDLFVRGFYALQKHVEGLSAIVQVRTCVRTLFIWQFFFPNFF